jgi:ADP-ribosylation factor-like protein 6
MNQRKMVVIGEGGVGKSTLISLLQGKNGKSEEHSPTIGVNVEKYSVDKTDFCIWDFGGQKRFQFMWNDFLRGSSLTILVTDSSYSNVKETKEIIKRHKKQLGSKIIAIANKQDVSGSLSPKEVSEILGVPTYGMVAINNDNRKSLFKIMKKQV